MPKTIVKLIFLHQPTGQQQIVGGASTYPGISQDSLGNPGAMFGFGSPVVQVWFAYNLFHLYKTTMSFCTHPQSSVEILMAHFTFQMEMFLTLNVQSKKCDT